MSDERGLVISNPVEIEGTSARIKSSDLDSQELRFSLLLWDKLNFPTNNLIHMGLTADSQFLLDAGVLSRLRIQVAGSGDMAQGFRFAHVHAFRLLDQREPGVWSLATGERSISFLDDELDIGRGALMRLHKAIPVPDKDVPLQDILEFRSKRRSELLALRHHLEIIYQRIVTAGDGELALNTEVGALEQAIADHIKASKEARFSFRGMSIDASLNVPGGLVAGLAAYSASLSIVTSLLSGVGAAIAFGPGVSLKGHKVSSTPFRYVSSYQDKLF
jgi:hypothetical protein